MPLEQKQPRTESLGPPYDHEMSAALDRLGPPIALFRVLARRPELARALTGWGGYYLSREVGTAPSLARDRDLPDHCAVWRRLRVGRPHRRLRGQGRTHPRARRRCQV